MTADDVAREASLRREFFRGRLECDACDLRDVVDMTIDDDADVCLCDCGMLVRVDPTRTARRFAQDHYDDRTLESLRALHADTFLRKKNVRALLPAGSRVLEIGSYCCGFLEAARQWGWTAKGIDIGRDTAAFATSKGYDVTTERFERCDFDDASFDGVFIWSCFEQMTDADAVLDRVRQVLRDGAPLGLYVPDAAVYIEAERAFSRGEPRNASSPFVRWLAYNNLLGFPHRFGYTLPLLERKLAHHGFGLQGAQHVPAIRPLRESMTKAARDEEARTEPAWIEAIFR